MEFLDRWANASIVSYLNSLHIATYENNYIGCNVHTQWAHDVATTSYFRNYVADEFRGNCYVTATLQIGRKLPINFVESATSLRRNFDESTKKLRRKNVYVADQISTDLRRRSGRKLKIGRKLQTYFYDLATSLRRCRLFENYQ